MRADSIRTTLHMILTIGLSGASTACLDLETPGIVRDARILGLSMEPAEVVIDGSPLPPAVEVRALVVDPRGSAPSEIEWRTCFEGFGLDRQTGRCEPSNPQTLLEARGTTPPVIDTLLPVPPSAPLLVGALTQRGFPLSLLVQTQLRVGSPEGDLFAIKRLPVSPAVPEGRRPNQNPRLSAVLFDGEVWSADAPLRLRWDSCPDSLRVTAPAGQETPETGRCRHKITPVFQSDEAQEYSVRTYAGTDKALRERLRFHWYSTGGSFSSDTTQMPGDVGLTRVDPLSTRWTEPTEAPDESSPTRASTLPFWVVVQDGRGGESWVSRTVEFERP